MFEIIKKHITKNRSYKSLIPQGIVVHETDNPGGTAEAHYRYFNSADRQASAHAFIDWDIILQTIPWDEQAWHAGAYANTRFIGIELCRPSKHDDIKFGAVWEKGIWLFAHLYVNELNIKEITKDNLLSHDEIRIRFGGTTHTDPTGYFKEYGKTVIDFRKDVQNKVNELLNKENDSDKISDWAKEAWYWVKEKAISDGTRPKDFVTREEIWTMLYRLGNN